MSIFDPAFCLTRRQQEIGFCLLQGMTVKAIAKNLNLSVATVREHQTLMRKKLLCQNAYQVGYYLGILFEQEKKYLKPLTFKGKTPDF